MKTANKETVLSRMTLRLPSEMLNAIDSERASRPGNISRNTWVIEAVAEKLKHHYRELTPQSKEASNG